MINCVDTTTLDLASGFGHVVMTENCTHKTAFLLPNGHFKIMFIVKK